MKNNPLLQSQEPYTFPAGPNTGAVPPDGLTLRDYFAAKAMPSLISDKSGMSHHEKHAVLDTVAARAYDYADAMLAQRLIH